ncbi:hypothetical protein PLICRDRAFT_174951 [Plicaturopsis crispa FD-325 SS-3]|nr:hypothetical protein PLICRDRAFT_174951 [Plicaturopsis crispa FD-325 SS-3]
MSSKILAVIGATGVQGRSILDAFSEVVNWKVLALTRNPDSASAKEAAQIPNVTVVKADLNDHARLVEVLRGVDAVYENLSVDAFGSEDKVVEIGKSVVDAAKKNNIGHFIHALLPNLAAISKGKYTNGYHYNASNRIKQYIESQNFPATYLVVGWYLSNLHTYPAYKYKRDADGTYVFSWPTSGSVDIPYIDARRDTGKFVRGILTGPTALPRPAYSTVRAESGWATFEELVATWGEVHGVPARFEKAERELWVTATAAAMNAPREVVAQRSEMFSGYDEFGATGNDEFNKRLPFREFAQGKDGRADLSTARSYFEATKSTWALESSPTTPPATPAAKPVVFILGYGNNIGKSVAARFAAQGYSVAVASRSSTDGPTPEGYLAIRLNLDRPLSVRAAFDTVVRKLGAPRVVVYNAAAGVFAGAADPLVVSAADLSSSLNVNVVSSYTAAQAALAARAPGAPLHFIYTGNALNKLVLPALLTLGVGKSGTLHWLEGAAKAYSPSGAQFYYADERMEDGKPAYGKINGEAHADFYTYLAGRTEQGPVAATFVKGKGYVNFPPETKLQ